MFIWTLEQTGLNTAASGIFKTDLPLPQLVGGILNGLFSIIGLVFLALMVYGGMLWLLSEGEEKKIKAARGFIFHSIVGLILVLAAFVITNYVVKLLVEQTIVSTAAS